MPSRKLIVTIAISLIPLSCGDRSAPTETGIPPATKGTMTNPYLIKDTNAHPPKTYHHDGHLFIAKTDAGILHHPECYCVSKK